MLKRKLVGLLAVVFVLALAIPAWAWTEEELRIIKERQVPYDPNYTTPHSPAKLIEHPDSPQDKSLEMTPEEAEALNNARVQAIRDFIQTYGYPVTVLVNVWGRYTVHDNRTVDDWYNGYDVLVNFPDMKPYVDNNTGRTMIPIRFVAEKLGAQVDYQMEAENVVHVWITKGKTNIEIRSGENKALVSGKEVSLDAPVRLINNRTVVPLRFMAEVLGCNVYWMDVTPSGEKYPQPYVTSINRNEKVIVDDPDGGLDRAIQYMQERKQNKVGWGWKDEIYLQTLEEVKRGAKPYPVEPVRAYITGDSPKAQPPVSAGGSKLSRVVTFFKKPAVKILASILLFLLLLVGIINRRRKILEQREREKRLMMFLNGPRW